MDSGKQVRKWVPELAREEFLVALRSGLSQSAAATLVGVTHTTGYKWARAAGVAANLRHRGTRYSAAVRAAFWAAMSSGASPTQAAVIAGVSENTGRIWVQHAGYVPRTQAPVVADMNPPQRARAPLTFTERCRLEELLENGYEPPRAAVLMRRHKDTINREIGRGQTSSGYRARVGQDVVEANAKRPKARKLEDNPALLAEVLRGLDRSCGVVGE